MSITKTYSEERQEVLFRASRELRRVACNVLDDVVEPAELTGRTTVWAKSTAAETAKLANELEERGHEQCVASRRSENALFKVRREYEAAIDAFEARITAAGGALP
jgi:hypothetical protein